VRQRPLGSVGPRLLQSGNFDDAGVLPVPQVVHGLLVTVFVSRTVVFAKSRRVDEGKW
jgi:hypothetical protein